MSTKRQETKPDQIEIDIKKAFEAEIDSEATKDTLTALDQFLDDQKFCPLCGDELLYTHVAHFVNQTVAEEAHCECCNIRVKNNTHHLQ